MIGSRIAHYEIVRKLGSGGMGDIYAARDTKLGREIALKVLPAELAGDTERRKRFEREARTAAALSHPNIVTLYSVEEADGACFLTMELVEGQSLADQIPEDGFEVDELLRIAVSLADALATAHEAGIIHRDLKPANVMLTADGVTKVLDFGLAKLAPADEPPPSEDMATQTAAVVTTGEGRILGTPAYMSPEQAEGKKLDPRTDIFSLGVVLYEMATGRRPFEGDSAMSTISSVLKDTPPSLVELRAELPPRLGHIVGRCLVKDRRRRYQTARDLASDLEDLRSEKMEAASVSQLEASTAVVSAPAKRKRALVVVAGILFMAGAVAFGYLGGGFVAAPSSAPSATAVCPSSPAGPRIKRFVRLTTKYGLELGPQISPDGKWFVYAAGAPGNLDVFRQRIGGHKRNNLTEAHEQNDWQPAISPDGERIAFRSERGGGGIFVMGSTGESVRRVTDFGHHPAWSPDGKHLLVSTVAVMDPRDRSSMSEAWEVEVESGNKRRIEIGCDAVHGAYSPNGRRLAFDGLLPNNKRHMFTVAREGGEPLTIVDGGPHTVWTPVWAPDGQSIYFATLMTGAMNISRVQVDATSGKPVSTLTNVTAGAPASAAWPSFSADGKRLLLSLSAKTGNIAKIRFDPEQERIVGELVMLTRGANGFAGPDLSPDGEWIAFSSWIRHDTPENIYVARSDGTALRILTNDADKINRLARWTRDGHRLLFYSNRSGNFEHWSVAHDGSALQQITHSPGKTSLFAIPEHNGTRVVGWTNEQGLFVYHLGKPLASQKLLTIPRYPESGPQFLPTDWSPDGKRLAGWTHGGELEFVYIYSFDTQQYEKVAEGCCPRWLDDGKRILYTDVTGLKLVDAEAKKSKLLLSPVPDETEGHLAISPDQRWIYFSLVTQDGDIWLAELE